MVDSISRVILYIYIYILPLMVDSISRVILYIYIYSHLGQTPLAELYYIYIYTLTYGRLH